MALLGRKRSGRYLQQGIRGNPDQECNQGVNHLHLGHRSCLVHEVDGRVGREWSGRTCSRDAGANLTSDTIQKSVICLMICAAASSIRRITLSGSKQFCRYLHQGYTSWTAAGNRGCEASVSVRRMALSPGDLRFGRPLYQGSRDTAEQTDAGDMGLRQRVPMPMTPMTFASQKECASSTPFVWWHGLRARKYSVEISGDISLSGCHCNS